MATTPFWIYQRPGFWWGEKATRTLFPQEEGRGKWTVPMTAKKGKRIFFLPVQ